FQDPYVHNQLQNIHMTESSLILPTLYVLLVLPRDILTDAYPEEFKHIQQNFARNAEDKYPDGFDVDLNTYKAEQPNVLRHLRNAVAHADVKVCDMYIEFRDQDRAGEQMFRARMSIEKLNWLIEALNKLVLKHVHDVQKADARRV